MQDWGVEVLKLVDDRTVWIHPHNIPVFSTPPYPVWRIVEDWLEENFPGCIYRTVYNECMPEFGPYIQVEFQDSQDLVLFMLQKS